MNQLTLFDYASLDNETSIFVQEKAQNIHGYLRQTIEGAIAIGRDLVEVKEKLPDMKFSAWLRDEFDMSRSMAYNFMNAARRFPDGCPKFGQLSILYELASPSMPETVIEMVKTGQIPATLPAIREAKQELAQSAPPPVLSGFGQTVVQMEEAPTIPPVPTQKIDFHQWKEDNLTLGLDRFGDVIEEEEEAEYFEEEEEECPQEAPEPALSLPVIEYVPVPYTPPAQPYVPVAEPLRGVPPALLASESNEWYTPAPYVETARELMGGIDIDPASNVLANQIIQATTYYDIETNGLDKKWAGRVWLNPPYGMSEGRSNQEIWTQRLIQQFEGGITTEAILLVNANTEAKWFQPLYDYLICFTNHRIRFYNAGGTPNQPTQGNALVYLGGQRQRFIELFRQFGRIEEEAK